MRIFVISLVIAVTSSENSDAGNSTPEVRKSQKEWVPVVGECGNHFICQGIATYRNNLFCICPESYKLKKKEDPERPGRAIVQCEEIVCGVMGKRYRPGESFIHGNFEYLCYINPLIKRYGIKVTACIVDGERIAAGGVSDGRSNTIHFACEPKRNGKVYQIRKISWHEWDIRRNEGFKPKERKELKDVKAWLEKIKRTGGEGVYVHSEMLVPEK